MFPFARATHFGPNFDPQPHVSTNEGQEIGGFEEDVLGHLSPKRFCEQFAASTFLLTGRAKPGWEVAGCGSKGEMGAFHGPGGPFCWAREEKRDRVSIIFLCFWLGGLDFQQELEATISSLRRQSWALDKDRGSSCRPWRKLSRRGRARLVCGMGWLGRQSCRFFDRMAERGRICVHFIWGRLWGRTENKHATRGTCILRGLTSAITWIYLPS